MSCPTRVRPLPLWAHWRGPGIDGWGRTSFKLKRKHVRNSQSDWIRSDGAFAPIVDQTMFNRANAIIAARSNRLSDDEMLDLLRTILGQNGALSGLIIDEAENCPSSSAFHSRFGSLLRAYSLVGFSPDHDYRYLEINRSLRRFHRVVLLDVIRGIELSGGTVVQNPLNDLLTINREFTAAVVIARCKLTSGGSSRWKIRLDTALIPSDPDDDLRLEAFTSSLFEIGAARNNNRQLADEAKANKKGLYDHLRTTVPADIAKRVEWKSNDGGDVKIRDIVALSWIPLALAPLPAGVSKPRVVDIYSGKGKCSSSFDALMEHPEVSSQTGDGTFELYNTVIGAALAVAGLMPKLYDLIYCEFPAAYNDGGGRFGRMSSVKMASDMKTKPVSAFTKSPVQYSYPDGFIMPLVYGLSALMETDADGNVGWRVSNPAKFVSDTLPSVVRRYRAIIEAFSGDPQKIGKNEGAYTIAKDAFETELLKLAQNA